MADSEPLVNEIFIDAEPELVYRFLTERDLMLQWMGVEAEIDPRPGGLYRVSADGRDAARGTYVEVEPNRKVVFTWGFESGQFGVSTGSTLVEITLEERATGTLLRLVHKNLPSGEPKEAHERGWQHYLARLQSVAQRVDPGPDPWREA
jgi:uncharacterized protein YndB with AHSA1/START domain